MVGELSAEQIHELREAVADPLKTTPPARVRCAGPHPRPRLRHRHLHPSAATRGAPAQPGIAAPVPPCGPGLRAQYPRSPTTRRHRSIGPTRVVHFGLSDQEILRHADVFPPGELPVTVCDGGRCRRGNPARTTYRIALTISRRGVLLPPPVCVRLWQQSLDQRPLGIGQVRGIATPSRHRANLPAEDPRVMPTHRPQQAFSNMPGDVPSHPVRQTMSVGYPQPFGGTDLVERLVQYVKRDQSALKERSDMTTARPTHPPLFLTRYRPQVRPKGRTALAAVLPLRTSADCAVSASKKTQPTRSVAAVETLGCSCSRTGSLLKHRH